MTALHWTALNGDLKTMNVLLYRGRDDGAADARRAGTRRCTWRARAGTRAVVSRLLEAGSKAGAVTETGVQPTASRGAGRERRRGQGAARARRRRQREGRDARPDAAHLRGLAESARGDEGAAREGRRRAGSRRPSSTTASASAADNQARQVRDRIVSATTGRATNSNININDPPPAGAAAAGGRAAPADAPAAAAAPGRADSVVDPNDPAVAGQRAGRGGGAAGRPARAVGHRADRAAGRLHRAALRRARRVRRTRRRCSSTPA